MKRFHKVGLTGGIATGKSTVASLWSAKGVVIIDSDELARRSLEPGTDSYREVLQKFGHGILHSNGTVNRAALGDIVFNDDKKRQILNQIIHPLVRQMWLQLLRECEADAVTEIVAAAIPLLYEVEAENEFECIVTVGCSETTQKARLVAKGLTETQAMARIRAQMPLNKKMDRADFVIWNDGSLDVLAKQAETILHRIKETAHAPQA